MNWKEDYKRKLSKPTEAIKDIFDGQCVVMGHAAAAPHLIQQTLADHCEDLIRIAHPDFRQLLAEEYERRFHCRYQD